MSMIEKIMYVDNLDDGVKEIIFVDGTRIRNAKYKEELKNKDGK